ncbi:hypothetical protein ACF0H5_014257 [Mactra antiquata]
MLSQEQKYLGKKISNTVKAFTNDVHTIDSDTDKDCMDVTKVSDNVNKHTMEYTNSLCDDNFVSDNDDFIEDMYEDTTYEIADSDVIKEKSYDPEKKEETLLKSPNHTLKINLEIVNLRVQNIHKMCTIISITLKKCCHKSRNTWGKNFKYSESLY